MGTSFLCVVGLFSIPCCENYFIDSLDEYSSWEIVPYDNLHIRFLTNGHGCRRWEGLRLKFLEHILYQRATTWLNESNKNKLRKKWWKVKENAMSNSVYQYYNHKCIVSIYSSSMSIRGIRVKTVYQHGKKTRSLVPDNNVLFQTDFMQ